LKSSRTIVNNLEKRLIEEKNARERLEREVFELKKFSESLSSSRGGLFG